MEIRKGNKAQKTTLISEWLLKRAFFGGPYTVIKRMFMKSAKIFNDRLHDELVGQVLETNLTRKVLITGGQLCLAIQ